MGKWQICGEDESLVVRLYLACVGGQSCQGFWLTGGGRGRTHQPEGHCVVLNAKQESMPAQRKLTPGFRHSDGI